MTYKTKLIEVALPLDAINSASAAEKNPFVRGHPRSLHRWWAPRPLAACRAVLFASLVDDPSANPDLFPTEADQEVERKRLFGIIENLVRWENSNNSEVIEAARTEIAASCEGDLPALLDPFCGGGSIPLEAQRLGLEPHASDLNPVAVLISKALIEIPPRFAGQPPVRPQLSAARQLETWDGAQGLAEDIRYYGTWIREQAEDRIGRYYPTANLASTEGGDEAPVLAWIWARTVTCPNPACGADMPLVRSFVLSTKKGKEARIEPVVDQSAKTVRFDIATGKGKVSQGTVSRRGARCIVCETPVPFDHVRKEGRRVGLGVRLMAIVAKGQRGRIYIAPDAQHEDLARSVEPRWAPETELVINPRDIKTPNYGITRHRDLFTNRQLMALGTLTDMVGEARQRILEDALRDGLAAVGPSLADGGSGASAYAEAVAMYLALSISRFAEFSNTICSWDAGNANLRQLFARQAIPMAWDFVETNPISGVVDIDRAVSWVATSVENLPRSARQGVVRQFDAAAAINGVDRPVVCTDPPYYDNIGYADLSDFFYVWLRPALRNTFPDLFSTLLTPKAEELVATPYRFGGDKAEAEEHFESGLSAAFTRLRQAQHPDHPTTVFYAFKQAEEDGEVPGIASTGWETILNALLSAGFSITGTWPMRTEQRQRAIASGKNALASSVVLVCRPRPGNARLATRKDFLAALRSELPDDLTRLQHGNIAPVDLAQASIGPGIRVFSRYSKVVEADGSAMSVRAALALINQVLDEILAEQEGDFDAETRWAVAWFEEHGMNDGPYGQADVLARAKDTATNAMVEAGILRSGGGKVRLLDREELASDWDPSADSRLTVWEVVQHLVRGLGRSEQDAADLLRRVGGLGEAARELAYRLYVICERKGWAKEALAYNSLVVAWPEIGRLAASEVEPVQQTLVE